MSAPPQPDKTKMVQAQQPTLVDKLTAFCKQNWLQLLIGGLVVFYLYCRKAGCSSAICRKMPSVFNACSRPIPGGLTTGPDAMLPMPE